MTEWHFYVSEERERQLVQIIQEEKLKEAETRKFLEDCFRNGEIKTTGTDIDKLMPPVSRFGGGNRAARKQGIIEKLRAFFERFFGIGSSSFSEVVVNQPIGIQQNIDLTEDHPARELMVADEPEVEYKTTEENE